MSYAMKSAGTVVDIPKVYTLLHAYFPILILAIPCRARIPNSAPHQR